jgi:hypothetical protein
MMIHISIISFALLFASGDSSFLYNYLCEPLIETYSKEEPYDFYIHFAPNPFGPPSKEMVASHHCTPFMIDNEGNLLIWRYVENYISIIDLKTEEVSRLTPLAGSYKWIHTIQVGPDNALYVRLKRDRKDLHSKVFRFMRKDGEYILDRDAVFPEFGWQIHCLNISPDNTIYSNQAEMSIRFGNGGNRYDVFDENGNFLYESDAWCKTMNGLEFSVNFERRIGYPNEFILECKRLDDNKRFFVEYLDSYIERYSTICTFDNNIIFVVRKFEDIPLPGDRYLHAYYPAVIIISPETEDHQWLDLKFDCYLPEYAYFNFGIVRVNYLGDIYAQVVYYNIPGEISPDDKVIIYRWRRAGE